MMTNPKFQIHRGKDRQFYFRLIARNGRVVLRSEGYASKSSCEKGIRAVKANVPKVERFHRKGSSDGQFYFTLTAANGEIIGVSERYTTKRGRDDGIQAVRRAVQRQ